MMYTPMGQPFEIVVDGETRRVTEFEWHGKGELWPKEFYASHTEGRTWEVCYWLFGKSDGTMNQDRHKYRAYTLLAIPAPTSPFPTENIDEED